MTETARSQYGPCFGQRGILTQIGRKVQCHICGKAYLMLGMHVSLTHGMTVPEYKHEFGLQTRHDYSVGGYGLASEWYAQRLARRFGPVLTTIANPIAVSVIKAKAEAKPIFRKLCRCGATITWRVRQEPMTCGDAACISAEMADAHRGHTLSDETKDKIAVKARQRMTSEEATRIRHMRRTKPPTSTCQQGHPFTPENTVFLSGGRRRCRICRTNYMKSYVAAYYRERHPKQTG